MMADGHDCHNCRDEMKLNVWMRELPFPAACLMQKESSDQYLPSSELPYEICHSNPAFSAMLGFQFRDGVHPEPAEAMDLPKRNRHTLNAVLQRVGSQRSHESLDLFCPAWRRWAEVTIFAVGEHCLGMILQDISTRLQAERELQQSAHRAQVLFNVSRDGIVIIGQDHRIIDANDSFCSMLGYSLEELRQLHTWDYEANMSEDQIRSDFADLALVDRLIESRHRRKDGSSYSVELSISGAQVNYENVVIAVCRDITKRKERERLLEYLSYHDTLTDLANRTSFDEALERLRTAHTYPLAILIADVDNLSEVNNQYGHVAGDAHIAAAADLLRSCLRQDDFLARIGGDEFAAIMMHARCVDAQRVIDRVSAECLRYNATNPERPLAISLGCAEAQDDSEALEVVVHRADMEMYRAKRRGR